MCSKIYSKNKLKHYKIGNYRKNPLSLQLDRGDSFQDIRKKKKRYAYLVSWKRRKIRTWHKRWHNGSHAIAWAAIIISIH